MNVRIQRARALAILTLSIAGWLGWFNLPGGVAYAQYYCVVTCSASAPNSGDAGVAVPFNASSNSLYCEGTPSYAWTFGDGESGTGASAMHAYKAAGTYTWTLTVSVDDASVSRTGSITIGAKTNVATGVSAASYDGSVFSSEQIVAAFGTGLATSTVAATTIPLPTSLAGTTVKVKDSAGTERLATLFFVSPGQINYEIPVGTVTGNSTVTITSGDGTVSTAAAPIAIAAPGLFTANANGQGVPSGYILRVRADNSQSVEPLSRFDSAQNKFIAVPIDMGPATDQIFLVLFGTGMRYRSALSAVSVKVGGESAQVLFVGPQGDFVGLDQLNVQLPRSIAGRGDVDWVMTVDGKAANTVRVTIK